MVTAVREAASYQDESLLSEGGWNHPSCQVAGFSCPDNTRVLHKETRHHLMCIVSNYKGKDKTLQLSKRLCG